MSNVTKVLIANRGEIAVRVIRACRELGIETVAVYSEADRNAMHVLYADEAYFIGPPQSRDSYLRIDKIMDVAKKSEADAVHPGYGFLAERDDFAQACEDEGITFIGPKPASIAAMGDKVLARNTVRKAGVPVVPGTESELWLSDEEIHALAPQIGYPLLIKASAGGGGKGMREVKSPEELTVALASARREAEAAFGDGNVYLEKLITGARHIEIQLMADTHGNIIYLGERECSLQRRHQRVLEEAPSPFVGDDDDLRSRMGEVACRAAAAVNYVNAGTIEFLVDKEKNFYFLEMNTRLQVEHPVTELVTGIDIVKEQIRVARGRELSRTQSDVRMNGWAIECRVNAEDPYNNFMPSTGTVTASILPTGPGVRVDTGVYVGYTIPRFYDSMISKVICWGDTRGEALLRMRRALEEYKIVGVKTNIPLHQKLLDSLRFQAGNFDTRFLEERFSMETEQLPHPEIAAIVATLVAHQSGQQAAQIVRRGERDTSNWKWVGRYENAPMKYLTTIGDKTYTIEINDERHIIVDGTTYEIDLQALSAQGLFSLIIDNKSFEAFVENEGDEWRVLLRGNLYETKVADERAVRLTKSVGGTEVAVGDFHLKAPMPGLVVAVPVNEGQAVNKGDILIILESMKMQNELESPRDGTVLRVKVKGGDSVEQNQVMVTVG